MRSKRSTTVSNVREESQEATRGTAVPYRYRKADCSEARGTLNMVCAETTPVEQVLHGVNPAQHSWSFGSNDLEVEMPTGSDWEERAGNLTSLRPPLGRSDDQPERVFPAQSSEASSSRLQAVLVLPVSASPKYWQPPSGVMNEAIWGEISARPDRRQSSGSLTENWSDSASSAQPPVSAKTEDSFSGTPLASSNSSWQRVRQARSEMHPS